MKKTSDFAMIIHAFFTDWLGRQRELSTHTIRSYRDTWRLFLRFLEEHRSLPIERLALRDITIAHVLEFLEHHERTHSISTGTRNCRLAGLRALFDFAARQDPTAIAQASQMRQIPRRRGIQRPICYLEQQEVDAILAQPDRSTPEGQRDHALMVFLYNTGARIQEALDLCPQAVRFESPCSVRLFGKGRRERVCPMWPETSALLRALLRRRPRAIDHCEPLRGTARGLRRTAEVSAVCYGSGQVRSSDCPQTDFAPHFQTFDCGGPCRPRGRHPGHSRAAGTCSARDDSSLRTGEHANEA